MRSTDSSSQCGRLRSLPYMPSPLDRPAISLEGGTGCRSGDPNLQAAGSGKSGDALHMGLQLASALAAILMATSCEAPPAAAAAVSGGDVNIPATVSSTRLVESDSTQQPSTLVAASQPGQLAAVREPNEGAVDSLPPEFRNAKVDLSDAHSAPEYLQSLMAARPPAWQQIAQSIGTKRFTDLSEQLAQKPFEDVRSASFYIPWVLLQNQDVQVCL